MTRQPTVSHPKTGQPSPSSTPRIIVKGVCLVGVFLERDEGVSRLGGEPSKALALEKMHKKASAFFDSLLGDSGKQLLTGPNLWHSDRYHKEYWHHIHINSEILHDQD